MVGLKERVQNAELQNECHIWLEKPFVLPFLCCFWVCASAFMCWVMLCVSSQYNFIGPTRVPEPHSHSVQGRYRWQRQNLREFPCFVCFYYISKKLMSQFQLSFKKGFVCLIFCTLPWFSRRLQQLYLQNNRITSMAGLEANKPANTCGMQRSYDGVIYGVFL